MDDKELLKLTPGELVDLGVCPTCFNRKHNGVLYGDNSDKLIYEDKDIECFFVGNPRADGHMCISAIEHYHDLSEAPDYINEKIIRFAKQFMIIIKEIYKCERVYMCTMCDGPNNHYHIQLIPRYRYEKRGSKNFVKERHNYIYDETKFNKVKDMIQNYVGEQYGKDKINSQYLDPVEIVVWSITAWKRETFIKLNEKGECPVFGGNVGRFCIPKDESADIDTEEDWNIAEATLLAREKRKTEDIKYLF